MVVAQRGHETLAVPGGYDPDGVDARLNLPVVHDATPSGFSKWLRRPKRRRTLCVMRSTKGSPKLSTCDHSVVPPLKTSPSPRVNAAIIPAPRISPSCT